jgi:hypothetical protein
MSNQLVSSMAMAAEKRYNWLEAAKLYSQVLLQKDRTSKKTNEIEERIAFCYTKAAFQSGNREEFVRLLGLATSFYNEMIQRLDGAERSFRHGKTTNKNDLVSNSSLEARVLFLRSKLALVKAWAASDFETWKRNILQSRTLGEQCLSLQKGYDSRDEEIGKYASHLLNCYAEEIVSAFDRKTCEALINKAVPCGELSIRIFSKLEEDKPELIRACYLLSWFCYLGEVLFNSKEHRDELSKKKSECWDSCEKLLGKYSDPLLASEALLYTSQRASARVKRMEDGGRGLLPALRQTKDNIAIAGMCGAITFGIRWRMFEQENPEKASEMLSEIRRLFEELDHRYSITSPVGVHWSWLIIYHWMMISGLLILSALQKEKKQKQSLLDEALELAQKARKRFEGYSRVRYMDLALAQVLKSKAELEDLPEIRYTLMRQALSAARSALRINEEVQPHYAWDQGVLLAEVASVAFKLAGFEQDEEEKKKLLDEAIVASLRATSLLPKIKPELSHGLGAVLRIASSFEEQSSIWMALYELGGERISLNKRLLALEKAKRIYESANLPSRIAETLWEIALTHSLLSNHMAAASFYDLASKEFEFACQKIPSVSAYYHDYSTYMKAFSEIEKAKASHIGEKYELASDYYRNASELLSKTSSWNYLSSFYTAFAELETAEGYSAMDDTERAIQRFSDAEELFLKSHNAINKRERELSFATVEEASITFLAKMASGRRKYCTARKLIEQARFSHKWGDVSQSMLQYSSSAEILTELKEEQSAESEKKEIDAMIYSCMAWQKMEEAETESSVDLFNEAAKLFSRVHESSTKQKSSLISRGNENFCLAMALGLEFKQSMELERYRKAKSHLVEASNCYSSAGIPKAADWFTATERMFDAYVYIIKAPAEPNPEARAREYGLAEKILEQSAEIFDRSGYSAKRNAILAVLSKVKEEKEFVISLAQILSAPTVVSSTATFSPPDLSHEGSLRLAELKRPNIQIALSFPRRAVAGEHFTVKVDLINTGREPATLHKIEGLLPSGTMLDSEDQGGRRSIEESGMMDFEGKVFMPLQMDTFSYTVKLKSDAVALEFNPKVYYSDQSGKLCITQAELQRIDTSGLLNLNFSNDKTKEVLNCLVKSFINDLTIEKLHEDRSGWRTISQISNDVGMSPSTAYGKIKGGMGPVFVELQRRGLMETRVFPGERGRGGNVTKVRIPYAKEPIRDYISQVIGQ